MARLLDALLFILTSATVAGCADLTRPPAHRSRAAAAEPLTATLPVQAAPDGPTVTASAPAGALDAVEGAPGDPDQIEASHILVAYRGATRAKPTVTRSKEEARRLANELMSKARQPGTDFAQLARATSDGPSGIEGGALKFRRQQMVKPFSDAAFALKPGEISDVVETNFGFHVIKRTE